VIECCDRLIAQRTNNEEVYKIKADALFAQAGKAREKTERNEKYRQAAESYTAALGKRINYPEAYLYRALMHYYLEDKEASTRDIEKAVSMNRPSASWYALRGSIQYVMYRDADALRDFERANQLTPNDPGILNNLGTLYYQTKEYARSKDCYDKVLAVNPKNADALAGRGAARLGLNDSSGALEDFNAALQTGPGKKDIRYRIAIAYYTRREWVRAEEEFNRYLEEVPKSDLGHYYRAFCRYHQARYREAIDDWEVCLRLGTKKVEECQKNIAAAKKQLGEP
jgi:tetratricopeptide (TPR) repeat protein